MAAVAADIRECPQDEVFASGEKHGGVADAVGALHTGLRDVSATTDALPTGEEVRLLPFEDLGGRVCLGRKHPTRAERGEGPGDCCLVNRCDGMLTGHSGILWTGLVGVHPCGESGLLHDHRIGHDGIR